MPESSTLKTPLTNARGNNKPFLIGAAIGGLGVLYYLLKPKLPAVRHYSPEVYEKIEERKAQEAKKQ